MIKGGFAVAAAVFGGITLAFFTVYFEHQFKMTDDLTRHIPNSDLDKTDHLLGSNIFSDNLEYPQDIAIDGYGNIYVSDTNNHRILVFDINGNLVSELSTKNYVDSWSDIAIRDDLIYITDSSNHTIQVLDLMGNKISEIDIGIHNGKDFVVHNSLVYVTDPSKNRIQVLDINGNDISEIGNVNYPSSVAIYNDLIYVADPENSSIIQIFDLEGNLVNSIKDVQINEKIAIYPPETSNDPYHVFDNESVITENWTIYNSIAVFIGMTIMLALLYPPQKNPSRLWN